PARLIFNAAQSGKAQAGKWGPRQHPTSVTPAYNEAPVVSRVVAELGRAGYAAVVVDDGSRDATADAAHAAGAAVVSHPFNLGQAAALQTGIDYALAQGAEVIVTFDAAGQHRVSDISRLTAALRPHHAHSP